MAGDITRFTFNALSFFNSETIDGLDNEEVGQYVLLMCKSILLGKECSLPDDIPKLANYARTTPRKLSPAVLAEYPVVLTEYGPRRRNSRLYEEWLRICDKSVDARDLALRRWEKDKAGKSGSPKETPLESVNGTCDRNTAAVQTLSDRYANRTIQNTTEQYKTEQAASISLAMLEFESERSNIAGTQNGRQLGVPGYFARGQYPGTSTKAIWKHAARSWSRMRGESAVCRFPTKHPSVKTDAWEDLCDTKSGDLMIPAFELWIERHGKHMETQYPLSKFLKGNNVQEFMSQVSPLNEVKPKISAEAVKAVHDRAAEIHKQVWAIPEPSSEPSADDFLTEEQS